jgi:hypothetical protein
MPNKTNKLRAKRARASTRRPIIPGPYPTRLSVPANPPTLPLAWKIQRWIRLFPETDTSGNWTLTPSTLAAAFPITNILSFFWKRIHVWGSDVTDGVAGPLYVTCVHFPSGVRFDDIGTYGAHRPAVGMQASQLSEVAYSVTDATTVLFEGVIVPYGTDWPNEVLVDVLVEMVSASISIRDRLHAHGVSPAGSSRLLTHAL